MQRSIPGFAALMFTCCWLSCSGLSSPVAAQRHASVTWETDETVFEDPVASVCRPPYGSGLLDAERLINPELVHCETPIVWFADIDVAFSEARRLRKPVFVIQLSGNLRNEDFT